jgi:hypothetical protein
MNFVRFRILALFALANAACLVPTIVFAQKPPAAVKEDQKPPLPPATPRTDSDFQIIRLKYIPAVDCAKILNELLGTGQQLRIVADPITNSLLLAGTPGQLTTVTQLIIKLDVDVPGSDRPATKTAVFSLRYLKVDHTLDEALRLMVRPSQGAFALDPRQNQVIVSADPKTLDEIKALLDRLDNQARDKAVVPTPEVQLRVVWLASGLPQDASKPPADLKDVVEELGKIGVGDLRLVSQSVVMTMTETSFTLSGSGVLATPCELSIKGTVSAPGAEPPTLQINIDATRQTTEAKSGVVKVIPVCRVATQIVAPPGHSIVLGVTPSETLTSVFIVQLMPKLQAKPPTSRK